jgi:hypothetical protein
MDSTNLPLKIANVLKSNILQELIDKEITTKKQVIRLISEDLISELEQDVDVGQGDTLDNFFNGFKSDQEKKAAQLLVKQTNRFSNMIPPEAEKNKGEMQKLFTIWKKMKSSWISASDKALKSGQSIPEFAFKIPEIIDALEDQYGSGTGGAEPTEAEKKKVKSAVANMLNRQLFTGPIKKGGKPKPKEMLAAIEQAKQGNLPISGFDKLPDPLKKYAIELFNGSTRTKAFVKSLASAAIDQLKPKDVEKTKQIIDQVADKLEVPEAAEEVASELAADTGATEPEGNIEIKPLLDRFARFIQRTGVLNEKINNVIQALDLKDTKVFGKSLAQNFKKQEIQTLKDHFEDTENGALFFKQYFSEDPEFLKRFNQSLSGESEEEGMNADEEAVRELTQLLIKEAGDTPVAQRTVAVYKKLSMGKLQDAIQEILKKWNENGGENFEGVVSMAVQAWQNAGEKETDPEETEGGTDPQMYDPDPEKLENLQNAYEEFRDEFYRSKYLVEQGKLVKALLDALRAVHEEEEREAAAIRTKAPPKLEEAEAEQVEAPKDELANLKADFRAFYENIRDAEDLLGDFKEKAEQGKFNSKQAKEKITSSMTEIQADVIKLHSDLEKIIASPATQEQEKLDEVLIGSSPEDRKQKYEQIENAHDEIVKLLNGVLRRLNDTSTDSPQPESPDKEENPEQMDEAEAAKVTKEEVDGAVKSALKQLEGILGLFPSVKPFEGEVEFDQLDVEYKKARKKLDFDVSNIQTLVKGGPVAEISIRRQMTRLIDFAADIERIFGVKGQVKGSNITQADAATPADETPTDPAGADDSSKPDEEPKEKIINDRTTAEKFVEDSFLPRNLFNEIYEGNENIGDAQYNALLTFILLSRIRQPVQEASLPAMATAANKIFGLGDEKTENMLVFMRKALPEKFEALNVLFVMGKNKVSDLRMLLQKQMKNRPFQFVTRLDKSMAQKLFKSSAAEPSKPSEETPSQTYKERLMKILLPLIKEHLQRSQRG